MTDGREATTRLLEIALRWYADEHLYVAWLLFGVTAFAAIVLVV